jgi:predicted enzyme related to lactoylglutathione lyase
VEDPPRRPVISQGAHELWGDRRGRGLITVTDMDAAQNYCTAFGWRLADYAPTLASRHPRMTARSAVSVSPQGRARWTARPALIRRPRPTVVAVKDAGGTIAEEPYAFPGGRRFTFFDPSGNRLGVWSTTEATCGSGRAITENADPSARRWSS